MNFTNPSADRTVTIDNATIDADTIVVFVGARNISSLAFGGPGGYSSSGSEAWLDLVAARGQPGALENPESDFGPWGGSITFDSGTNWYFGATTEALNSGAYDFLSVATHELGHVLGVGTAASWSRYVFDNSFSGPNSMAENDAGPGEVPLADDAHFQEELEEGGQEVAMDPTLLAGTRKNFTALDFAALKDIGWEVGPGGGGTETGGGGGEVPAPETYTINVSSDAAHTIVIRDDSDPTNNRMRVVIDGVATTFVNPTGELIINGGSKNDRITFQSLDPAFAAKITINAGAGHDKVDASAISWPLLMVGDLGKDTLIGGGGDDTLQGGDDNDSLIGNGGDDALIGEAGRDAMFGGSGSDMLDGGAGNDTLQGQAGDDSLTGGFGNDLLSGKEDNDVLQGDPDLLYNGIALH